MRHTTPYVITINRQLGSGGAYIGQQLADKLNIFYADREIIRNAAKELSVMEEDIDFRDEKGPSFWQSLFQTSAFIPDVGAPQEITAPTDREIFDAEAKVIEHIAKDHSAVIIGRCGFHILHNHPNLVSIFLHGDQEFRNEQLQKQYQITKEEAEKLILRNDKERTLYCKTYTGKDLVDSRNYNLTIDTSKLGMEKTIECIMDYLRFRNLF